MQFCGDFLRAVIQVSFRTATGRNLLVHKQFEGNARRLARELCHRAISDDANLNQEA